MPSKSIHDAANGKISFFFIYKKDLFTYLFYIHLTV